MQLSKAFTLRGLRSKNSFLRQSWGWRWQRRTSASSWPSYMVGSRYGVWAPQDLNYSDAVNLRSRGRRRGHRAHGFHQRRFLFRLFAIPFVERVTKSRVLAVILPAFSWSFLHSAYPQEPGYIRGNRGRHHRRRRRQS